MLLGRITQHVKDQNWFAVAIDFVIVVVGVFIGIQVSNWNDTRVSNAQEASYLRQLKAEIAFNANTATVQTEFVKRVVSGGKEALSFLERDVPCTAHCEDTLIAFFHASQIWGTPYSDAKYQETTRLGLPNNALSQQAVQEIYKLLDGWDTVNTTPPAYRERVRGHISPEAAASLWRDCYRILNGAEEELTYDCRNEVGELDPNASLERMRQDPELATMLRFWIGQNEYALQNYPEIQSLSAVAIDTLNQKLDTSQ